MVVVFAVALGFYVVALTLKFIFKRDLRREAWARPVTSVLLQICVVALALMLMDPSPSAGPVYRYSAIGLAIIMCLVGPFYWIARILSPSMFALGQMALAMGSVTTIGLNGSSDQLYTAILYLVAAHMFSIGLAELDARTKGSIANRLFKPKSMVNDATPETQAIQEDRPHSPAEPRSKAKKMNLLATALLVGATLWLAAAVILGLKNWACPLPWSRQCVSTFFGHAENIILFAWVKDTETIVAGFLAVAAAAVSVIYLRKQISQAGKHEARRLRRQHRAAKAVMPDALSALCAYATESALRYRDCLAAFPAEGRPDMDRLRVMQAPELPLATVMAFQGMIAASPKRVAEPFVRLLADLQVHQTRWQGFENSVSGQSRRLITSYARHNFMGEICEAAELYANATDLFHLVRPFDAQEPVRQSRQTLRSALLMMGLIGEFQILALAEERESRRSPSTAPGIAPLPSRSNH
ncbi:hypothetical protein [Brevundimonas phoenicis]|uniref:hypothetical protein n=1 Tax=unclassified Brevundimonas TaxID=2622653 RepID=UPI0039A3974F